jgi:hypothetical protein
MKDHFEMDSPASCNWIQNPNPLTEEEIKLDITWTADAKTTAALERQAACNECSSAKNYLLKIFVERLVDDEEDTVLSSGGSL